MQVVLSPDADPPVLRIMDYKYAISLSGLPILFMFVEKVVSALESSPMPM